MSELATWLDRIERQPWAKGDYIETDKVGRDVQVIVLHWTVIAYWTDDAEREVRVIRIVPNV